MQRLGGSHEFGLFKGFQAGQDDKSYVTDGGMCKMRAESGQGPDDLAPCRPWLP